MTTITLSPDHQKVAWVWLDKLLGRDPPKRPSSNVSVEAPPATKLSPRVRQQAIEDAYEAIKKNLIGSIKKEIGSIQQKERSLAQQAHLDPLYFNWFLINGKHWPAMSRDVNRALRAIQNMYLWYGAVPDHWNDFVVPDFAQGKDRDKALVELGRWFLQTIIPKIERGYVREIWKESQDLVKQFRGRNAPRDPEASIMLMQDFEKRLVADRFQAKPAVQDIVDLFS